MKKAYKKCVAACLAVSLTLTLSAPVFAFDEWDDFDSSLPPPPPPAPVTPSYTPPPSYEPPPRYEEPAYTAPQQPAYTPEPAAPSYSDYEDSFSSTPASLVDASSEGFIKVVRHPIQGPTDVDAAIIEGLQVTTGKGASDDEVVVTCYFIFRGKPMSYFYDVDRKEKKLVFEFMDTRTGSSPIAALEQAPVQEIVIDQMQVDANRSMKGLEPEWHDVIRITFQLEHLPVISVASQQDIISFTYKWTTNSEKILQYIDADKFPTVFWVSGGTLGGIGIGVLTYFLVKKDKVVSNVLSTGDLPDRPRRPVKP